MPGPLDNVEVRVCIASACSSQVFGFVPYNPPASSFAATIENQNGQLAISVDEGPFSDGDVWTVHVFDTSETEIFSKSSQVTYTMTGPDCEGRVCRNLTLAL
jgi:hypothetical protein